MSGRTVCRHRAAFAGISIHNLLSESRLTDLIFVQNDLVECLSYMKSLRTLHINFPFEANISERATISQENALVIVQHCSSSITQIGCNTEVWQV